MKIPSSTYRLQLRGGMDLARAEALVPYLRDLGIGALYLSPPFTAEAGSTHGYDITDANEIEPTLGGRAALERLSAALHERGMGLILDIVPNHMAFSLANPWLRDVLRRGEEQPLRPAFRHRLARAAAPALARRRVLRAGGHDGGGRP